MYFHKELKKVTLDDTVIDDFQSSKDLMPGDLLQTPQCENMKGCCMPIEVKNNYESHQQNN